MQRRTNAQEKPRGYEESEEAEEETTMIFLKYKQEALNVARSRVHVPVNPSMLFHAHLAG